MPLLIDISMSDESGKDSLPICSACGVKVSKEGRCCRSCGNKKAWINVSRHTQQSSMAKKQMNDPDMRKRVSNGASEFNKCRWGDSVVRAELCRKFSNSAKKRWSDPANREALSKKLKKIRIPVYCSVCKNEKKTKGSAHCQACSARIAREIRWKNPDARGRQSKLTRERNLTGLFGWAVTASKLWANPLHQKKMSDYGIRNLQKWHRDTYIDRSGRKWQMRSSWEVQFAEWLDALQLNWKYEPATIPLLNGSAYLPDFWVEEWKEYIEIKGPIYSTTKYEYAVSLGYPIRLVNGESWLHDNYWKPKKRSEMQKGVYV